MGLITIRVVAFLDILLAIAVIAQQIWYTADQLQNPVNGTQEIEPKSCESKPKMRKPVYFPTGQVVITEKASEDPYFKEHVPQEWLCPLLMMVLGMCLASIFASGALIKSAKSVASLNAMHLCNDTFITWIKTYAASILAVVIFVIASLHISLMMFYCIVYVILRGGFAVVLSEEFVELALSAVGSTPIAPAA